MEQRDLTRVLLGCGAVEAAAWFVAWLLDWQIVALVGAIGVSMGVAGVILRLQQRRRGKD